nr:DUF4367 domain-containing protein [uncultured Anaerotignum sp.]
MNTIPKNKALFSFLMISVLIIIIACASKQEKPYEYPLIETNQEIEIYLPQYVPQNYAFEEIEISPPFVTVTYSSKEGRIYYTQMNAASFSMSLDTENNTVTAYHSDHFTGYLLTDSSVPSSYLLSVYNDTNAFELVGNIKKEELFQMLESIAPYTKRSH